MSYLYPDKELVGYVLIKNIRVQNANAISSPITYGFPAITGFTGAIHALSRKISAIPELEKISLDGVLISCYECQPQIYREASYKEYTFNQTRNPILRSGKTASIIEEGRCHLRVSLVIGVYAEDDLEPEEQDCLLKTINIKVQQQRLAGGSVIGLDRFKPVTFVKDSEIKELTQSLLPAFILMNAQQELTDITQQLRKSNPEASALDALIATATLHHTPINNGNGTSSWQTQSVKQGKGWLVPIPIGFQAISECYESGMMQNVRNPEYPSQYVESIYGLGKWVFPHRIDNLADGLWYQHHDDANNLYLVTQNKGN